MEDLTALNSPAAPRQLEQESEAIGFRLASEARPGALLRALAASKPAGALLELGTGTGVGPPSCWTGWAGTDVARRFLADDPRETFHTADAAALLARLAPGAT